MNCVHNIYPTSYVCVWAAKIYEQSKSLHSDTKTKWTAVTGISVSYAILSSPFGNILTMLIDKMHTVFHRIWKNLGEFCLESVHRLDGNNDWKKDRGATVFIGWCKVIFFGSPFDDSQKTASLVSMKLIN